MRLWLAIIFSVSTLVCGIVSGVKYIQYTISIEGYLKRAGDSNSVELAQDNLRKALGVIEERGMTSGNTGVLWHSPGNDVSFWYANLKTSLDELSTLNPEATSLEKSNMLMKLRETLLDEGENISITAPAGISVYPNNALFFWWGWGSLVLASMFWFASITGAGFSRSSRYL